MSAKCFKALYGFCASLEDSLDPDDCALTLSPKLTAKLCQQLGEDYYTYMVIHDHMCHEIVRLDQAGGLLYIERGVDDTEKQRWSCGNRVKFDWVGSALRDHQDKEIPEKSECPEELFTGTIKNGNCTVYFKDGLAVKEKPNKRQIPDGCWEEPVITTKAGCIVDMAEGSNGHLPPPGCCG